MTHAIQGGKITRGIYYGYVFIFLAYLLTPLLITGILAFNNNSSVSFPWQGFTLKWFFSTNPDHIGVFGEKRMLDAISMSLSIALSVTVLSTLLGISNAFLFERENFIGKRFLYLLMLVPLVIPGVVLGISILSFAHRISNTLDTLFGKGAGSFLNPGYWLVVFGQLSFITTLATLVITARLKRFDKALEEAAMDLGASRIGAVLLVTFRFLAPAIFSAAVISFIYSFNNFNTTYFLIGTKPTLPVLLYSRLRFGITPEINAVSVLLIIVTGILGISSLLPGREKTG